MTDSDAPNGKPLVLDETDRDILMALQADASLSMERLAQKTGLSKTAVWNRVQRLQQAGVIERQTIIVNPQLAGLNETFFIAIKTSSHDDQWLKTFHDVVESLPEITEAHRLAGETDYLLKVQVPSTRDFDIFYKALVARVSLYSVTSNLSMETMKRSGVLPLPKAGIAK